MGTVVREVGTDESWGALERSRLYTGAGGCLTLDDCCDPNQVQEGADLHAELKMLVAAL